mgnify:CR=1 FL=1
MFVVIWISIYIHLYSIKVGGRGGSLFASEKDFHLFSDILIIYFTVVHSISICIVCIIMYF